MINPEVTTLYTEITNSQVASLQNKVENPEFQLAYFDMQTIDIVDLGFAQGQFTLPDQQTEGYKTLEVLWSSHFTGSLPQEPHKIMESFFFKGDPKDQISVFPLEEIPKLFSHTKTKQESPQIDKIELKKLSNEAQAALLICSLLRYEPTMEAVGILMEDIPATSPKEKFENFAIGIKTELENQKQQAEQQEAAKTQPTILEKLSIQYKENFLAEKEKKITKTAIKASIKLAVGGNIPQEDKDKLQKAQMLLSFSPYPLAQTKGEKIANYHREAVLIQGVKESPVIQTATVLEIATGLLIPRSVSIELQDEQEIKQILADIESNPIIQRLQ